MRSHTTLISFCLALFVLAEGCVPERVAAIDDGESPPPPASEPPPSSPPPADPSPGEIGPQPGDRILVDLRAPLQQANSLEEALARSGARFYEVGGSEGPAFTQNFDGQGTRAIRFDWRQSTGERSNLIVAHLPTPRPKRLFVRAKIWLGRTVTGGGIGEIGSFRVTQNEKLGYGMKRFRFLRKLPDSDGAHRSFDLIWPGGNPAYQILTEGGGNFPEIEGENNSLRPDAMHENRGTPFRPESHIGQVIDVIFYMQAASGRDVPDGVVRQWVNGVLRFEHAGTLFDEYEFDRVQWPMIINAPVQDQSEYWWDMVFWSPQQ